MTPTHSGAPGTDASRAEAYGWLVNFDKSHLQPTQRLLHLGAMLDTLQAMVFLAPDRITAITSIARFLMQQTSADVMLLARALGMFISTIHIVPWARAHTRPLQWILLPFQKDIASSNHRKVRLSPALRLSFRWWTKVQHLSKGTSFREPRRTVVTTDASLIGWGAHCNSQYVQGVWSNTEQSQSINWLGTKGCPLSPMSFSVSVPFASCAHSNRQHVCKITFEQTGGHQVSSSAGLSLPHLCLGRTTSTIPESRAPQRDLECDSRLAQQTTGLSGRMETSSSHFPSSPVSVRRPLGRSVCLQSQLPASQVLCPIPGLNSRSSGCSDNTVARRSIVRLSSHTIVSQNLEEGANRKGTAGSDSTILATPTVVFRSSGNVNDGSLDTSSKARPSIPGSSTAPGPYLVQSNSVAFERGHLRSAGLSDAVIDIILASRRPSTTRIYQHTWVAFSKWCQSHHHDPSQATVHQVLQFLHSGFMMGLRPNTLRRHASTLSSILSVSSPGDHISSHPFIKRFLRGVALRSPAVVHRFPSWSLPKVLQALQRPPFEPIRTVPLRILSFKVLFLIAITSARRVSELGALSSARHLCVFHKDSVVLKTDPSFRPKVDSVFHCNQDIVLPSFCPNPTHPLEKAWHSLDVRRALKTYLSRTQDIRRTESLFVSFHPRSVGHKVSNPTLSRWLRACITLAYESLKLSVPASITAHSTRSAATSAAFATNAPVADICRAAVWSTPHSFIRHYKIDRYASADASFGRRVLQQVLNDD
ncbi:store-operated calcium entry regulator STIMATE isoform X1 [Rhineura floridana]|uniref:store-operated calcium entry regulator STIMATE isoform X1 n=1 Tax=Rhineura floridana TaxID=261503 RepID=UPI002AC84EFD|nr:store-operated calcium entry regulator STIMATE isoform X1 [Rhineura floridana]